MRLALATAALLLTGLVQVSDAGAEENWASHLKVSAVSKDGKVQVVAEGKDGWSINTAFPMKITLSNAEKAELGKGDAKLEGEAEGKAKRAVFETKAKGKGQVAGTYKIVVCSKDACSPPIKGNFTSS